MQRQNPPRRNTAGKKRRRGKTGARLIAFAIVVAIVALAAYFIRAAVIIGVGTEKYYNVHVNGVALKGYTREEAKGVFDILLSDWSEREYTLTYAGSSWSFNALTFDASLDIDQLLERAWNLGHYGSINARVNEILKMRETPYEFTSELIYDKDKLEAYLEDMRSSIDVEPIDAEVVMDVDAPKIVTDSRNGLMLDVDAAREEILSLLLTGQGNTELHVEVIYPAVSSEEISGGLSVIASYATDMSTSSSNRLRNVKRALSNFNVMAVYDGDRISFNEVVGERSKERGYLEAPEYSGTSVITGYGGGSCQASTTLYCAVIMAGCDIIERHPHNMTVAYADPSLDATVSWGNKDFVFENNTGHTLYIYTKVNSKKAWVVIYGNKPENRISFESKIVVNGVAATKEELREDVTGKYAYYTDDKFLYSEGKDGCESQGWLVYYDWDSGEEVKRIQVSQDTYAPGTSIFFVGVHERSYATPEPLPTIDVGY